MSAASKLLEQLAEEGVALGRSAIRWLENRFAVEDTPENIARARRALSRVEPNVPPRPQARDFAVPARSPAPEGTRRTAQRRTPERPLAARPQRPLAARPEQAAEQPPALPPPAQPLPEWAAKPRGGQWWSNQDINGVNFSPERAAEQALPAGLRFDSSQVPLRDWWNRALTRYLRNDFATADDPLRSLAEQGLLHTEMSPDAWSRMAGQSFIEDRIGPDIVLPNNPRGGLPGAGDDFHAEVMQAMPWLARQPMTDKIYGLSNTSLGGLDFAHVADEMYNAMRPEVSGIPADLAVRPESLQRMSFPQAVERVGRINQWRAAQQAEASLAAQNNPALRVYREYAENNPRGLRWVEIAPPDAAEMFNLTPVEENGSQFWRATDPVTGETWPLGGTREEAVASLRYHTRDPLQEALRYEGDTMGHCVGGYCDDVLSGRSRIFSLRDARGEPHVTIEASPRNRSVPDRDGRQAIVDQAWREVNALGLTGDAWREAHLRRQAELVDAWRAEQAANPVTDIVQIKGKQNRAPNDEYLPFVQDFVRQGQWGNVGDLGNTGLVRLPDGRYITQQQVQEVMSAPDVPEWVRDLPPHQAFDQNAWAPHVWDRDLRPIYERFEGYAIGGRVDPDRCFCRHPFSAKR